MYRDGLRNYEFDDSDDNYDDDFNYSDNFSHDQNYYRNYNPNQAQNMPKYNPNQAQYMPKYNPNQAQNILGYIPNANSNTNRKNTPKYSQYKSQTLSQSNSKYPGTKFTNTNSDEDDNNIYQDALMSNLLAYTNKNNYSSPEEKKPTECRIDFVKHILEGSSKLRPMIDFDNYNTETATNGRLNKPIVNIGDLLTSMNVKLIYLKSGTTGHTFKAVSRINKNVAFAVKVCAYPKDEYGHMDNSCRPENAELLMLKLLSYFVINGSTPHFVLPIGTIKASITNFIKVDKFIDLNNQKNKTYKEFIERYHAGDFENFVSILISEWCNGGDLLDYIKKNYTTMTTRIWKVIIFQLLFTLALVHEKYPSFRHNDMKANNILVQLTDTQNRANNRFYKYNLDNVEFVIPNIGLQIKIWDFDFACIDGIIENNKVNADWTKKINISKKQNRYYDVHYFFNTLISKRFFPQFYDENGAPQEIIDFVHRIIPEPYRNGGPYVNKKGRILVDTEITTPYRIIMTDPLFARYRYVKSQRH